MKKLVKFDVTRVTAQQLTAIRGGKSLVLSEALEFSGDTISDEYATTCTGSDHDTRPTDND
ncbi:hypothetical protein GCM10028806_09520 [Spirosoma terrae]|uniref:Uncharacterized protein n=1 Tax=Spirosoma terrae TaxID=1968276 RepID=A0A6L9L5S5_9BACT|nr:hypothetical protein [Spirosoma terrae]NDU95906.1 hypothetical protein [Spirosoma terrae]